jgi:hypothetical protein
MDLGRVFIASAFGGLLDRRELAADAVKLVDLGPRLTEYRAAQAGSVREGLAHGRIATGWDRI